jgi:N-acetylglucosamine-6-sulfatase
MPLRHLGARFTRGIVVFLAASVALTSCPANTESPTGQPNEKPEGDAPNVLVILTDDQRHDTISAMPELRTVLQSKGVTYKNGFVVNSLCCPSRASLLTGGYSHTTGVYSNGPPHGGFASFKDRSTIATWLQKRGYRTVLIGKYLNGYQNAEYVPPGWDEWYVFSSHPGNGGAFFQYSLSENGNEVSYDHAADDYSTDVLARKAIGFIRKTEEPFFMLFAPFAAHSGVAAPRHRTAYDDLRLPAPKAYGEKDVSDKPAWVRNRPPLGKFQTQRSRLETLLAVDDAVARIVRTLQRSRELQKTFILFTSDNGVSWGEHGWRLKEDPYDPSIRVPFIVRYDPLVGAQRTDEHLALNIDIAPTIADLAGTPTKEMDGRSLLPLLRDRNARWRKYFLIEHLHRRRPIPTYCGVRGLRYHYVQYSTGEEELYEMPSDPAQLHNRANDPRLRTVLRRYRARLRALCDPTPPGFEIRR